MDDARRSVEHVIVRFHTGKGKDRRSMEDREIHTEKITTTITDRGMLIVMRGKGRRRQETRHGNFVEICTRNQEPGHGRRVMS